MRRSSISLVAASALLLGACMCSGLPTTSAPTTTTTTTSTTTTTTLPPNPLDGVGYARGLDDSLYPELGNGGYDVEHYTIDLTWDPESTVMTALVTINALAVADLDELYVDFSGFEIEEINVSGTRAGYVRDDAELRITPVEPIANRERFIIEVLYSGKPESVASQAISIPLGWIGAPDGTQYVVSEPDGAHTWFPCNDHPLDKAAFTFRVTVPEPLTAAASGTFTDQITDLGSSTWVWESDEPMATYLATVVIGDYQIVEDPASTEVSGVLVRNVLPTDLADNPPQVLGRQGEILAFLSESFGPYPFDTSGIALVPELDGAMESQTLSLFDNDYASSPVRFKTVLVHELAHHWFGNAVSVGDWSDIWLNEGFATYAEWLWIEHEDGPAALESTVADAHAQMTDAGLPPPGDPPLDDLFNRSVYLTGALTLHALRAEIGDDAFFETLRAYYARYAGGHAVTEDFVAVAEEVSATNLTALFDAWLHGPTVPELPTLTP